MPHMLLLFLFSIFLFSQRSQANKSDMEWLEVFLGECRPQAALALDYPTGTDYCNNQTRITCVDGNVVALDLNNTSPKLNFLGDSIGNLTSLKKIDVSFNSIPSLPNSLFELEELEYLNLRSNDFTTIPSQIGLLKNLKKFHITNNDIAFLPPQIGNLSKLVDLFFSQTKLTVFPSQIGKLTSLTRIDASNCAISSIATQIGQLVNLTTLDLSDNKIDALPSELGMLKVLQSFMLFGNNLQNVSYPFDYVPMKNCTLQTTTDHNCFDATCPLKCCEQKDDCDVIFTSFQPSTMTTAATKRTNTARSRTVSATSLKPTFQSSTFESSTFQSSTNLSSTNPSSTLLSTTTKSTLENDEPLADLTSTFPIYGIVLIAIGSLLLIGFVVFGTYKLVSRDKQQDQQQYSREDQATYGSTSFLHLQ